MDAATYRRQQEEFQVESLNGIPSLAHRFWLKMHRGLMVPFPPVPYENM